jgi:hypothetical protein
MKQVVYGKRIVQWPGAPPIYVTCMRPSELLEWAAVPRKSPKGMDGYQRPLADRFTKIARFIESHVNNIVPGSVIVASDQGDETFHIEELVIPTERSADHGLCKITITYDPPKSPKVMLKELIARFEARMTQEEKDGLQSRMAAFVEQLRHLRDNWKAEIDDKPDDDEDKKGWLEWIRERHKIGFIMDGQHRVYGADAVNPEAAPHIPSDDEPVLPISILPNMTVAEQVFHFAMMNITPEKVKTAQANNNAAFSLSKDELERYQPRLDRFIDTTDAIWLDKMDSDAESPFRGLIYYPWLPGATVKQLKDAIADSLQKAWRNADHTHRLYGSLLQGETNWKDEDFKMQAFFTFWSGVKNRFPDQWNTVGSALWWKVALMVLQDFIRIQMSQQLTLWNKSEKHPMTDLGSLSRFVEHVLGFFPQDFFDGWAYVPDDTQQGKEDLLEQMRQQYSRTKVDRRAKLWRGS